MLLKIRFLFLFDFLHTHFSISIVFLNRFENGLIFDVDTFFFTVKFDVNDEESVKKVCSQELFLFLLLSFFSQVVPSQSVLIVL